MSTPVWFQHWFLNQSSAPPVFGLNLLKGSENLDNTLDWLQRTGATVSADDTNDPNGELTAERVDFAANANSRIQQLVTLEASTTYTFSVYAKVSSGSQDFRLKALGVTGTGSFTALSSDWTRFDFDFTTTTAGTYTLAIMNATDGAARSIQFWGAMLNEGATAGDYVKTDASFGGSSPTPNYSGFGDYFVGVTAYYSLRQFTEAETLNAIRVRRSSDNTEQDIGFDDNGDLDTTALLAFVGTGGTDNGFVVTWYDQSGSGNDATQSLAVNQPKIVSAGSLVTENGKAAIDFDGVNDRLITSSFASTLAQPSTTFIVNNAPNNTSDNTLIDGIIVSNRHLLIANANNYTLNAGAFVNTGANSDAQSLLYTLWNGASSEFASDGGTPNIINIGTQGLTGLTIGTNFVSSNANDGNVQEIILYNSDQSSNRTGIETNINDYFSIYP